MQVKNFIKAKSNYYISLFYKFNQLGIIIFRKIDFVNHWSSFFKRIIQFLGYRSTGELGLFSCTCLYISRDYHSTLTKISFNVFIFHFSVTMPLSTMFCSRCGDGFEENEKIVNSNGELWHPQCFVSVNFFFFIIFT